MNSKKYYVKFIMDNDESEVFEGEVTILDEPNEYEQFAIKDGHFNFMLQSNCPTLSGGHEDFHHKTYKYNYVSNMCDSDQKDSKDIKELIKKLFVMSIEFLVIKDNVDNLSVKELNKFYFDSMR